ncbi:SUMO protein smt3 [Aspergillus niger]
MADSGEAPAAVEHLNIKVTDNNNEVFFKIKRTTQLKKLMDAFCERQGKQPSTVRFLFDGTRVRPEDTPDTVCSAQRPFRDILRARTAAPFPARTPAPLAEAREPQRTRLTSKTRSSRWPMGTLSKCTRNKSVAR